MDYSKKNYDHNKWPNYLAWKILRGSPKFRPPSSTEDQQQGGTEIVPSNDDDGADDEDESDNDGFLATKIPSFKF
jgi:hypothetical protein